MTTLGSLPLNTEFLMDSYDFTNLRPVRVFGRVIGRKGVRQGHAVRCVIADEEGNARTKFLSPAIRVHALGFLAPPADAVKFLGIKHKARSSDVVEHGLCVPFPQGQRRIA
jgi:hypothetical protein